MLFVTTKNVMRTLTPGRCLVTVACNLGWWLAGMALAADNWPQFRGSHASGVSAHSAVPDAWNASSHVVWKTPIPGRGWSSPVVSGERVFVTTVIQEEGEPEAVKQGLYFGGDRPTPKETHRWVVYCLDLGSGRVLWEKEVHRGVPEQGHHLKNSLASETPVTDGERLYAQFGNVGIFCFDFAGKRLWFKRWESQPMRFGWGTAASPVLHHDRIYLVNDNEKHSYLIALHKKTGEQIWRVDRNEKSNWATPFVWEYEKRTEIVTPGSGKIRSYDLNGRLLWELGGMSSITSPTPLAAHGLLYVTSGYVLDPRKPLFAIRPGSAGDITLQGDQVASGSVAWCQKQAGPYIPSPLVYGEFLYVLYDRGQLACYNARTGKEVYGKHRIAPEAKAFSASPWATGSKIYCLSEEGDTFVIQAGPEFKLLQTNRLGEMCMATPALLHDGLIIRTGSQLLRIK
jgi:outer membrane protein assembly factor BamB